MGEGARQRTFARHSAAGGRTIQQPARKFIADQRNYRSLYLSGKKEAYKWSKVEEGFPESVRAERQEKKKKGRQTWRGTLIKLWTSANLLLFCSAALEEAGQAGSSNVCLVLTQLLPEPDIYKHQEHHIARSKVKVI